MKHLLPFSKLLDTAARQAKAIDQISLSHDLTLGDAYTIQKESVARRISRGEHLTGLKLGFTSKAKMEQMGVHDLIWGRLTDTMQLSKGGVLQLDKFVHPRAEPEIAFLLKDDVSHNVDRNNLSNYVSAAAAAIEIIDSRYKNFKFSLEDVIADNCSSSGYVLGEWVDFDFDLSDLTIRMSVNDAIVAEASSNAILDDPINSLLEAFRLANEYGVSLKKGMVVLAGAATSAVYVKTGDVIGVTVERLGNTSLHIQ